MNYSYNSFQNPYLRNYQAPNYNQPQFQMQQQQMAQPQPQQMPIQQQMQQPMAQPMQQSMTFDTPIQCVVYATLKEAEAYILAPNTKGLFIDKSSGMIYEKICANNGQSSINYFKQIVAQEEAKPIETPTPTPIINTADFVKKSDLNGFITIEQYNELLYEFDAFKQQINALNQPIKAKNTKEKKAVNNNDADE